MNQSGGNKYLVFGALAVGLFASVVDHGSVIVALPSIAESLNIELQSVQWVVIGFALVISALLLPMGRLADMIGQKRVYILGSVIMMFGAAGAGMSPNLATLLLARIFQGVGAAMTQGTGMAIMTSVFPSSERGRAIGMLMTTVGVGAVAGPAIGGIVVDFVHWRAVFFLNIPLGLLGVAATLAVLRRWESERAPRGSSFDWLGAALSTGVLVALLLGLTLAVNRGWMSAPILAAFVLSASMFVAFIWWELRAPAPMFNLRFFRERVFSCGVAAAFLTFLGQSSVLFLMPFYIQNVLGYSPKIAGMVVMPGALCMAIMGSVSGTLSDKFGWRWFTVGGMICSTVGLVMLSRITETSPLWEVIPRPDAGQLRHGNILLGQLQLGVERGGERELRRGVGIPEPGAQFGQCDQPRHRHHHSDGNDGFPRVRAEPGGGPQRHGGGSARRVHRGDALLLLCARRPGDSLDDRIVPARAPQDRAPS